jgi:hypothetical protein
MIANGQPLAASFMDYIMPRADLPKSLRGEEHPTPSKISPLGVKGMGESAAPLRCRRFANAGSMRLPLESRTSTCR